MPHVISAIAVQASQTTPVPANVAPSLMAIALAISALGVLSGFWFANSRTSLLWSDPERHRDRQQTGYSVAGSSAVVGAAVALGAFLV